LVAVEKEIKLLVNSDDIGKSEFVLSLHGIASTSEKYIFYVELFLIIKRTM
jgi:hypothetical protein